MKTFLLVIFILTIAIRAKSQNNIVIYKVLPDNASIIINGKQVTDSLQKDMPKGNYTIEAFLEKRIYNIEILQHYLNTKIELTQNDSIILFIDFSKGKIEEVLEKRRIFEKPFDSTYVEHDDKFQVFFIVDHMPEFPGGNEELRKFIAENLQYPDSAKVKEIEGRVFVQFIVNKYGFIQDVTVVRGIDSELDSEAVRVISRLPRWVPGNQNGNPANIFFTVPINFQLN